MDKPCTYYLFPVIVVLLALAGLGVPERAIAQDYCYRCTVWTPEQPDEEAPPDSVTYFRCKPMAEVTGYQACKLSRGGRGCAHSNDPEGRRDCYPYFPPDGVLAEVPLETSPQAVDAAGLARRRIHEAVPSVNLGLDVSRRGCVGAITRRRYSLARMAELRSELSHVTI